MVASTPANAKDQAAKTPAAPFLLGGSTQKMLELFERARGKVTAKVTRDNPYFVSELRINARLDIAQQLVEDTKKSRDSILGVKSELEKLLPGITESTTIKPNDKKDLLQRAAQLDTLIADAAKSDIELAQLEEQLRHLGSERLKQRKNNYAILESATNPSETAKELLAKDQSNIQKIETHQEEIKKAIKILNFVHKKISQEYTALYDSVPGILKMKPFSEVKKVPEPSLPEPQQPSTPRASG